MPNMCRLLLLVALLASASARTPSETELVDCALDRYGDGGDFLALPQFSEAFAALTSKRLWAKQLSNRGYPDATSLWRRYTSSDRMTRSDAARMIGDLRDGATQREEQMARRSIARLWC